MPLAQTDLAEGKRAGAGVFASSGLARFPSDAEFEKSHFSFEVVVEMGLDGEQRFLTSFKTTKHDGALKRRNDESRQLLGTDSRADFTRFDSGADHRNEIALPPTQSLARTIAQHRIPVIGIDGRVKQRTTAWDNSAPLNKVSNELLQPVNGV
jgi:hypothetical protein